MKPHLYVPAVLALAAALGALTFANVVTQGFSAEGCRFAAEDGERLARAGDYLLVQGLLFGLPTAVLVTLLYRITAGRLRELSASPRAPQIMAWCFGGAFAAATLSVVHFLLTCGVRTGVLGAIAPLAIGLRFAAPILALLGAIALLVALFQGLGKPRS